MTRPQPHRPPWIASALYKAVLPPGDDAELGDLVEEYTEWVAPSHGWVRARVWFWQQVLRSALPSLLTPLARWGWRPSLKGFGLGVAIFYGLGLLTVPLTNAVRFRWAPEAPFATVFGIYLVLSVLAGYLAGRAVAAWAGASATLVACLLCALILTPEFIGIVTGSSSEGAVMRILWGTAVPLSVLYGARSIGTGAPTRPLGPSRY